MTDDLVRRLREPPFGTETSERNLMAAAADEIERLRAGGCARDQTTTQFCAEAAVLQAENARLRADAVALQSVMERMREWESLVLRDRATVTAENARLREALEDARNNGLIYWEPRTERGYASRAQMLSRIDAALAEQEKTND